MRVKNWESRWKISVWEGLVEMKLCVCLSEPRHNFSEVIQL